MIDTKLIEQNEDLNDNYYHFLNDVLKYPEAWCYIVWSPRGSGKTYSALWESKYLNIPTIYMKRTNDDVDFICSDIGNEVDTSPYYPINRDKGTHVISVKIDKGVGGFYDSIYSEVEEKVVPNGAPFNLILSLNRIKAIKGFDASKYEWLLLDEFIPQAGEVVKRKEGEMLLDLYMTINRDRQKRGLPPLKLILFANAEEISTPVTNTLEVVDDMADLMASGQTHLYVEERGIMLHHITREEYPMTENEKKGIYKAMANTAWGAKAFEGTFSNNDFSNVRKVSLKGYQGICRVEYKNKKYYIYSKGNKYYMTYSRHNVGLVYNLNRETEQVNFCINMLPVLNTALINDNMLFEKYTMYDLVKNYKKFFKI